MQPDPQRVIASVRLCTHNPGQSELHPKCDSRTEKAMQANILVIFMVGLRRNCRHSVGTWLKVYAAPLGASIQSDASNWPVTFCKLPEASADWHSRGLPVRVFLQSRLATRWCAASFCR